MWKEQYILVGDLFESFANHSEEVLTRSAFYQKLENETISLEHVQLWLGQGVHRRDIELLIESTHNPLDAFEIFGSDVLPRANRNRTHKHRTQNVLVSTARKVGSKQYELMLALDEANEFLDDHMSGLHVQGMALVEASRQAFLSVTEQFYLAENDQDFYFVINSIATDYTSFLFPLPTRLSYKVIEETLRPNRLSFVVEIELIQNDQVCATSNISFTAYENQSIVNKEIRAAATAVKRLIEQEPFSPNITSAA
jgi:acyl-CoA thioesterase FadM